MCSTAWRKSRKCTDESAQIISKAIHRSSKPDLAIEVAMEAGRRGVDSVPTLLKKCSHACCGWRAVARINRETSWPFVAE